MKVALVYVHPRIEQRRYLTLAKRFVDSYTKFPPGVCDHDLHVIINGDEPRKSDERTFEPLSPTFHQHNNIGKDIGAFQMIASKVKADLMVFMGSPIHFRRAGWLDVMVNAYERNGPGIYGAYAFHEPNPHIRTTCFWMPPDLLNAYPFGVGNHNRYEFEHGRENGIVKWVTGFGLGAWLVMWNCILPQSHWRHVLNEEALVLDQHSDRIGYK